MAGPGIGLLESILEELLGRQPDGYREYDLIKALQGHERLSAPDFAMDGSLRLYRTHFLLFHALYRLRDRLWQQCAGHVVIGPLRIAIEPYRVGGAGLASPDPLRAYYSDLSHLESTTEEEVEALLQGFWDAFAGSGRRQAALAVLGLTDPVDAQAVRQRYRQLAMRHHPDRGGDAEHFKAIAAAMRDLEL